MWKQTVPKKTLNIRHCRTSKERLPKLMTLALALAMLITLSTWADERSYTLEDLILRAGNAETDEARLAHVMKLRDLPGLDDSVRADADRLIHEINKWLYEQRTEYFGRDIRYRGGYDLGISEDSPLWPLALIYKARMYTWVGLEYGGIWKLPEVRRPFFDEIRPWFEELSRLFPENRILRMYLGEPVPPHKLYPGVPDAPEWAIYQREAIERLTDIITWWIDNRLQENGEYGGGWGDDCEMWRVWVPSLIGFEDPKIVEAQAFFSKALLNEPHMAGGYTNKMSDVEHTSEDSMDTLTPMMLLEPDNEEWVKRSLRLAELMEDLWIGVNDRGMVQFKSTFFTSEEVNQEPRKACDTVYHTRAVQPALLYWQRTGDEALGKLFTTWLDTWVDAAARAERGKSAGIVPSAIHWPDGAIGGLGENWWKPGNYTDNPLYVWPSDLDSMCNTFLLAYHMTGNSKYLKPLQSMAQIRLNYLKNPPQGEPEPGSEAWCASKLDLLTGVIGKYRLLTGGTEFDELLAMEASPYVAFRMYKDKEKLTTGLRHEAEAFRVNFPGYTSEVRYTDRVVRYPVMLNIPLMFPEPPRTVRIPDINLLYASITGDPGGVEVFPMNAVRWLTPPRNIAALVTDSGIDTFAAELFHFSEKPRPMAAELYLLAPGKYSVSLRSTATGTLIKQQNLTVTGHRTQVRFELPPRTLCELRIDR